MSAKRRFRRQQDELTAEQLRQVALTKRGLCSRCGQTPEEHSGLPDMLCADRAGCYSFAFDRESKAAAIARLERISARLGEGARQRKELSADAMALLDALADAAGMDALPELIVRAAAAVDADQNGTIGRSSSGDELAARLGWAYDRVRLAAAELEEQGLLQTQLGGALS